jgi:hypothetical protein
MDEEAVVDSEDEEVSATAASRVTTPSVVRADAEDSAASCSRPTPYGPVPYRPIP